MSLENRSTRTMTRFGLIFILLIFHQPLFSQNPDRQQIDSLLRKAVAIQYQNFAESDSLYESASKQITQVGIEKHPDLWIQLLHSRTNAALFHSKLTSVKKYLSDSYSSLKRFNTIPKPRADSLYAQTKVLEANYFYVLSSYTNALANFNEAEMFFRNQGQTRSACATLFQILQFQASIYQLQGELESCIDRYLASMHYYDCSENTSSFHNYILIHRNVGLAYSKMGNLVMARKYFFSAKANFDSCPEELRDFTIRNHALVLYNSLAEFYSAQKKIDSAKFFYRQALPILSANANYVSRVNEGLGKIALAEKDYAAAHELFSKSLSQTIQSRGEKHYLTANLFRSISSLYHEQKDQSRALLYLQKALASLSSSENLDTLDFAQNPPLSALAIQKQTVITLHQKATTLTSMYHQNARPMNLLTAARNTNLLTLQFIDSTRNEFNLDKDKFVLGEEAAKIYQTGIYLAALSYKVTSDQQYLSECFELIDKSKSAVLTDHIKLVKNFAGIPADLVGRQRELKVELSHAEQQLYNAEIRKEETSQHRQRLGEIKKAYTTLLNDIKLAAPNYYKLRIENKASKLPEIQKMLLNDEVLVEYFMGDTILYEMVVTPTETRLYTTPVDSIPEQVESLRKMLTTPGGFNRPKFQQEWNQRTRYLSQKLITPWAQSLSSLKRIVIIPHDVLNYLPFEVLPSDGHTLINTAAISYASSATLLKEQKEMHPTGNFFAGFNADYSTQKNLPKLAGATNELNSLKNIFGFRSSTYTSATADDFRKQAPNFKIIHLALHSLINDEKPMFSRLVFTRSSNDENEDITANELYSMELNAEIAVLSACETGLGKLHRGEGMMSLSRAFMYAGVPSTVISLWKVPDQSASILMKKFYQFLKNGNRKDEALRLAKLEFVKENPELSHPFFWAGFIVNGKTDPVTLSYFSKRELLGIVITLACLLIITGIAVRLRKRKATQLSV